jgi:hypothetical protein
MLDAAATAITSMLVLGSGFAFGGCVYYKFYKWPVLHKMENAFKSGDPVLKLAEKGKQTPNPTTNENTDEWHWIVRMSNLKLTQSSMAVMEVIIIY